MPFAEWIRQPHTIAFLTFIALICIAEVWLVYWLAKNEQPGPPPRKRKPLTDEEREKLFAALRKDEAKRHPKQQREMYQSITDH